jgi:hypothetical protein
MHHCHMSTRSIGCPLTFIIRGYRLIYYAIGIHIFYIFYYLLTDIPIDWPFSYV